MNTSDTPDTHASRPVDLSEEDRTLGSIVEHLYRELPRHLGFHRASLMLYDEESQTLISDDLIGVKRFGEVVHSAPQPVGFSISGKCFLEQRAIVIDDCSQSDMVPREFVERLSLKSVVAVPVTVKGKVIGVLRVDDTERTHRFTPEDVEFLSTLAEMLGIVATNPRLFRELREAEEAVRESERNFRALAENANDGILIALRGGGVVYANLRASQITGVDAENIGALRLGDLLPDELCTEVIRAAEPGETDASRPAQHREILLARPDGIDLPAELTATPTIWRHEPAVMVILRDITERRRLERQVMETGEDEQRRIGRDLHDGLGQTLAAIAVRSKVLERALASTAPEASRSAAELVSLAQQTIEEAHLLARGLSPVHLESRGLAVALSDLAADLEHAHDIQCRLHTDSDAHIDDAAVASQLHRIAQEAGNNAVKHGRPTQVEITLARRNDEITLTVRDDGTGFPDRRGETRGMGLEIMRHRARMIGAKLTIKSRRGSGVTVRCSLRVGGGRR